MKSWLIKFRISSALDDREPLPPAVRAAMTRSEEARRFAENSRALDQALKSQWPRPGASASLHASIMRAVRAGAHAPVTEPHPAWPRWIPVTGLALLVFLGVFLAIHFSRHPGAKAQYAELPSLAAASSALELGGSLIREAPAAVMSPLSDEMQRLERDWDNAKRFLFATLP
jgi:hypothetical protein